MNDTRVVAVEIDKTDSPSDPSVTEARSWLASEPILNNLILTVLETAHDQSLGATVWLPRRAGVISGVAVQSPPGRAVVLSIMPATTAAQLGVTVGAVTGVIGDAAAAAAFAGAWTEEHDAGVRRIDGQRLYKLGALHPPAAPAGALRRATSADHDVLAQWAHAFIEETGDEPHDVERDLPAHGLSGGRRGPRLHVLTTVARGLSFVSSS